MSQLVQCANAANLRFAVRGGGHSYEAMSLINAGLVIDLQRMDSIQLVPGSSSTGEVLSTDSRFCQRA